MLEYKSGETNLVVTSDKLTEHEHIRQAQEDGCPVVSVLWIHMCLHLNRILPFQYFMPKTSEVSEVTEEVKLDKSKHKKQEYVGIAKNLVRE